MAKWENSRPMEYGRYKSCLSKDILALLLLKDKLNLLRINVMIDIAFCIFSAYNNSVR